MRHLITITDPHHLLAELATRRNERQPHDLLAFSALPDAPVRPVVERRAGMLRRLSATLRTRQRTPSERSQTRPALAVDVTCS